MGYADWTEINVVNTSGKVLSFQNAQHEWGKFYSCENGCQYTRALALLFISGIIKANKDLEMSLSDLNTKVAPAYGSYKIGACGRENTWSGADGSFELWDKVANAPAAKIKYYSPHGTSYNQFSIDCPTKGWTASQTGAYLGNDQALGAITLTVSTD